jgi:hypothetical protein
MAIPRTTARPGKPKRQKRRRRAHLWKDKHYRWVPDGQGDWRVQAYVVRHHHKPKRGHFRGPGKKPPRRAQTAAAALPAASSGESRPAGAYQGPFGVEQATRLLNRAGFGAVPGQAERLASLGFVGAVQSLSRPSGAATLSGPAPVDDDGNPIAPADAWGHDHLWWLDRMVRGDQPLVERMALVFHDWFATSVDGVSKQQQMLDQSNLFRSACFGSFLDLFKAVTIDPAMLQWLNGAENRKGAPNENYAREMMELFSLGADRGAYTEDDIREQARALTGWRNDWSSELGAYNFRFDPKRHDVNAKTVFGRSGNWGWEEACQLCVEHPLHPSFFVEKLWSYFVPQPPPSGTRDALIDTYRGSGWQIRPVLEAILMSPDLYEGPAMVKPPVGAAGRDAAGAAPRNRHRGLGLALRPGRPGPLPAAQRLRLGRQPLARHLAHAGALEHRRLRPRGDRPGDLERHLQHHRERRRSAEPGARRLGLAGAAARAPGRASRLRPARRENDRRQLAARPLPGDAPERAAAADRRQPGHDPAMREI